jgi:hypothetical protein
MDVAGDPAALRRVAGWAFVCGLCLAALAAILALLSGSFDDTDERVIATSLGFSVFSSTGAAGAALRRRERVAPWALGTMALVSSGLAFVLLLAAVWSEDLEGPWRPFGVAGLIALWSAHAALVVGASQRGDSTAIKALGGIAAAAQPPRPLSSGASGARIRRAAATVPERARRRGQRSGRAPQRDGPSAAGPCRGGSTSRTRA